MTDRSLHEYIKLVVEKRLAGRPTKWLSAESGVPQSTLSIQLTRPKFSLDVLSKIAPPLGLRISDFFPVEASDPKRSPETNTELLLDLEAMVERYRIRSGRNLLGEKDSRFRNEVPKSDLG